MGRRWFQFHFQFHLARNNAPRWWLDLAVFDSVIRDVVQCLEPRIVPWRIHRRAGVDADGHQFTFLVYTDEETASEIGRRIEDSGIVEALRSNGLLRRYALDAENTHLLSLIEGTSDQSWPIEIQRAWPHFIMGASRMKLALLEELRDGSNPPKHTDAVAEWEGYYGSLSARVDEYWKQHGRSAYLHHLSALFGYKPILLQLPQNQSALVVF